ncbi:MAG: hypothetical protein AAF491_06695 [Verrucomicrobiota bacterium]
MITLLYRIPDFLRTTAGKVALLLLTTVTCLFFVQEAKERKALQEQPGSTVAPTSKPNPSLAERPVTIQHPASFSEYVPAPQPPETVIAESVPARVELLPVTSPALVHLESPPLVSSVETPSSEPAEEAGLPPGSLILCRLVNEVFSTVEHSPLIGIVCDSESSTLGTLLPKDSRVYGRAAQGSPSERLLSSKHWTCLTPANVEISFRAVMMAPTFPSFTDDMQTDGHVLSLGLPGTSSRPKRKEKKGSVATALLGAIARSGRNDVSSLLRSSSPFDTTALTRNLTRETTDQFAEQAFQRWERDGPRSVVPAGQFFYLFVDLPDAVGEPIAETYFPSYDNLRELMSDALAKRSAR